VAKVFTLAAFAYLARALGPAVFGRLEFCFAFVFVLWIAIDAGASLYGAREVARRVRPDRVIVRGVVGLRFWTTVLSWCVLGGYALIAAQPAEVRYLLLLFGISLLPLPFFLQWLLLGRRWMSLVGLRQVVRYGIFASIVLGWVRHAPDVWKVAVAEAAGMVAVTVFTIVCIRLRAGFWPSFRPALPSSALVREVAPLTVSSLMWVMKYAFSTALVGFMAGLGPRAGQVGYFGAAVRLIVAMHMFVALYLNNLLPSAARAHSESTESLRRLIRGALRLATWAAAAGAMLVVATGGVIIRVVYGPAFAPATSVLQICVWMLAAAAVSVHFRVALIASGRQGLEMASTAAGAVVQIALLMALFPRHGLRGAAAAMVGGEVITLVASYALMRKAVLPLSVGCWLWAPVGAMAVAGAMLMTVGGLSVWERGLVVAAVFLLAVAVLDRGILSELWRARPRISGARMGGQS